MNYKFAVILSAVLAGCGSGGDSSAPTLVATAEAVANVNPAIASAVVNEQFSFANGVPEFGTTTPTNLTFTGTGATPPFSITSDGSTRSGDTTFGSCTFTINTPGNLAGSIFIKDCAIKVKATGVPGAGGGEGDGTAVLSLNGVSSNPVKVKVKIGTDGNLFMNNADVGKPTTTPVTGGGS